VSSFPFRGRPLQDRAGLGGDRPRVHRRGREYPWRPLAARLRAYTREPRETWTVRLVDYPPGEAQASTTEVGDSAAPQELPRRPLHACRELRHQHREAAITATTLLQPCLSDARHAHPSCLQQLRLRLFLDGRPERISSRRLPLARALQGHVSYARRTRASRYWRSRAELARGRRTAESEPMNRLVQKARSRRFTPRGLLVLRIA
jgi:hypothetical protein